MAGDVVPLKKVGGLRSPAGGRPRWRPTPKKREVAPGVSRLETQDEAWTRTRQEISHYVAIGYPQEVICRLVEPPMRSDETLRAHFKEELENGRLIADAKVAGTAYFLAVTGRDPAMTRFWLRARCGWRDVGDAHQLSAPIQFQKIDGDDW